MSSNVYAIKIRKYFQEQLTDSRASERGKIPGVFEALRPQLSQNAEGNIELIKEFDQLPLSGNLCRFFFDRMQMLTAIFALYQDNTILWLDDHSNDLDYEEFLRREDLLKKMYGQWEAFVHFIIYTKFNYLENPRLIHSISDIPPIKQEVKDLASKSGTLDEILRKEAELESLRNRLKPLNITLRAGVVVMEFYVWTSFFGRVVRIKCFLDTDGDFEYEGDIVADLVGHYVLPR